MYQATAGQSTQRIDSIFIGRTRKPQGDVSLSSRNKDCHLKQALGWFIYAFVQISPEQQAHGECAREFEEEDRGGRKVGQDLNLQQHLVLCKLLCMTPLVVVFDRLGTGNQID